jgi:hypothetical protein
MDAGARAMFSTPPGVGPVGAVYDLALGLAPVDESARWAAVVRSPSGYIVQGLYGSWGEADAAVSRFWDGMRALLAPVEDDGWTQWRNANIPGGE